MISAVQLRPLLSHEDPLVRSRAANLVGNLARHSGTFYGDFAAAGLLPPLIRLCGDGDTAVRKFACFAIGNAGRDLLGNRSSVLQPAESAAANLAVRQRQCPFAQVRGLRHQQCG